MKAGALRGDAILGQVDGDRTLFMLPAIADDAPPLVREGLARRRLVMLTGQCPCGANLVMPNRAQRRAAQRRREPVRVAVAHERDCPAVDDVLLPALDAWTGGGRP